MYGTVCDCRQLPTLPFCQPPPTPPFKMSIDSINEPGVTKAAGIAEVIAEVTDGPKVLAVGLPRTGTT